MSGDYPGGRGHGSVVDDVLALLAWLLVLAVGAGVVAMLLGLG